MLWLYCLLLNFAVAAVKLPPITLPPHGTAIHQNLQLGSISTLYILNYSQPFDQTFAYVRLKTNCLATVNLLIRNQNSNLQQRLLDIPYDVKLQGGSHYWIFVVSAKMFPTYSSAQSIEVEIQARNHVCNGRIRVERGRFLDYGETYRSVNGVKSIGGQLNDTVKLFSVVAPPSAELPLQISVDVYESADIKLEYSWGHTIRNESIDFQGSAKHNMIIEDLYTVGAPIFSWLRVNAQLYEVAFSKIHVSSPKSNTSKWWLGLAICSGLLCIFVCGMFIQMYLKSTDTSEPMQIKAWNNKLPWKSCSVCLVGFLEDDECWTLKRCKHIYHKNCLDPWLMQAGIGCPICTDNLLLAKQLWRCTLAGLSDFENTKQETIIVSRAPSPLKFRASVARQSTLQMAFPNDELEDLREYLDLDKSDSNDARLDQLELDFKDNDSSSSTPSLSKLPAALLRKAGRASIMVPGPGSIMPFRTRMTSNSVERKINMSRAPTNWENKNRNSRRDPAKTRSLSKVRDSLFMKSDESRSRSPEGVPHYFKRIISSTPRTTNSRTSVPPGVPRKSGAFVRRAKRHDSTSTSISLFDEPDKRPSNISVTLQDPAERVSFQSELLFNYDQSDLFPQENSAEAEMSTFTTLTTDTRSTTRNTPSRGWANSENRLSLKMFSADSSLGDDEHSPKRDSSGMSRSRTHTSPNSKMGSVVRPLVRQPNKRNPSPKSSLSNQASLNMLNKRLSKSTAIHLPNPPVIDLSVTTAFGPSSVGEDLPYLLTSVDSTISSSAAPSSVWDDEHYRKRDSAATAISHSATYISSVMGSVVRPVFRQSIKRNPSREPPNGLSNRASISQLHNPRVSRSTAVHLPNLPLIEPTTPAFGSYSVGGDSEEESSAAAEFLPTITREEDSDTSLSFNVTFCRPSTTESENRIDEIPVREERRLSHIQYSRRKSQLINDAIFSQFKNAAE